MKKFIFTIIILLGSLLIGNAQHFVPVWTGNGYNHMNIYLTEAIIDGVSVQIGDEIGVFDGSVCVGSARITVFTGDYLEIRVSQDDPLTGPVDGFVAANSIQFKLWDISETLEYQPTDINVTTVSGSVSFLGGSTAVFTLEVDNNYPPIADAGKAQFVNEGSLVYLDASGSTDPDSDPLTYVWTTTDAILSNATAINPSFIAPEVQEDKVLKFFLVVNDGEFNSAKDSVVVVVRQVNKPPVINGVVDAIAMDEDTELTMLLSLLNTDDPDDDPLTMEVFGGANYNLVGNVIKPLLNYHGDITVPVRISDGILHSDIFNVPVTVNSVNDKPRFITYPIKEVLEGYTYKYVVKAFDIDTDHVLTFSVVKPDWLTFTTHVDSATLSGTPTSTEVGEHNIIITVSDGTVSLIQEFKLVVFALGNSPEVLTNEFQEATEGEPYVQSLTFVDLDSETLTVKLINGPEWITITGATDGVISVPFASNEAVIEMAGTPGIADVGTRQIVLEYSDELYTKSKMFALDVVFDNKAPIANNMTVDMLEDQKVLITLDGTDLETPDDINFSIFTDPGNGTLEKITQKVYKYIPDANFFGVDEFVYEVAENATELSTTATVTINVANVNDAPILKGKTNVFSILENTELDLNVNDTVIYNDDLDGVNADAGLTISATFGPYNGVFDPGTFTYTPNPNFVGNDVLFLQVTESTSTPNLTSEELKLQLKVVNVNQAPYSFSREVYLREDNIRYFMLFALDKEDDFLELVYEIEDFPVHGTIEMNYNLVKFTPDLNYFGKDTFSFKVRDLDGAWSDVSKVFMDFIAINDRPTAKHDTIDAAGNEFIPIDFSALVSDVDNAQEDLAIQFLLKNNDNTGSGIFPSSVSQVAGLSYTYQDKSNSPFDYLVYRVSDGQRKSSPKVVFINNLSTAKAGVTKADELYALGDSVSVDYGDSTLIYFTGLSTALNNDLEIIITNRAEMNGVLSELTLVEMDPRMPTVVYSAWYYSPNPAAKSKGNDTEVVFDRVKFKSANKLKAGAESALDSILITNAGGKITPSLTQLEDQKIDEGAVLTINVPFTDYDTPYGDLVWSLTDQEGKVLTSSPTAITSSVATFKITPEANFSGNMLINVKVTDTDIQSANFDFNLEVGAVNDAPEVYAIDDQNVSLNTTFVIPIAYKDVDTDESGLTFSAVGNPAEAVENITFVDNQMSVIFVADSRIPVTITVSLSDGQYTDSEEFILNVVTDNSPPEFGTVSSLTINEDAIGTLSFTPTDIDGDEITITQITTNNPSILPLDSIKFSDAAAASNVQKDIVISPVANKNGKVLLTIYLSDGIQSAVQEVEVTVSSVNDNPELASLADVNLVRGQAKSLSLTASDVDSYEFTFGAESDNVGVGVTVLANQLSILPEASFYGTANITVSVTDDELGEDVQVLLLTVVNNEAFVSSSEYTVDNDNNVITEIPQATTLADFKANITPANEAVFEVYLSDGLTVATDLATGYKLIVTAQDGVTEKTYVLTLQTGILDLNEIEISFYPNPTHGELNLVVDNKGNETIELEILSIIGQSILQDELLPGEYTRTIDLTGKPAGIYLIKLQKENAVIIKRLIVK